MSELSVLSSYVVNLTWDDVPEKVKEAAMLRVLDSVGAAVGGNSEEQARKIIREWLRKDGNGHVRVWGTGKQTTLSASVFLNAMLCHTQEMDDVHTTSKTHIGTTVIPAAWGVAEYQESTGNEFLLAVICGYEVMSRIGKAFGVSAHRNKGWHVTATAGTFGAAAAAGKLIGLSEKQMIWALGLAGAQSFGTWAFLGDGATCKVLNPARAAQMGVEAALLAQAGMSGAEHVLTAEDGGLLAMMSDEAEPYRVTEALGEQWEILKVDSKPYPSCRSTHCAIDSVLKMREKYQLQEKEIDHIEVKTYLVGYKQCGASQGSVAPRTAVNAKFSIPFTVACAIIYGEVTMHQFMEDVIYVPEIQDLMQKVTVEADETFTKAYPQHWGCKVLISTKGGELYEEEVQDASGSVSCPLSKKQVQDKAVSMMRNVYGGDAVIMAERILDISNSAKLPEI